MDAPVVGGAQHSSLLHTVHLVAPSTGVSPSLQVAFDPRPSTLPHVLSAMFRDRWMERGREGGRGRCAPGTWPTTEWIGTQAGEHGDNGSLPHVLIERAFLFRAALFAVVGAAGAFGRRGLCNVRPTAVHLRAATVRASASLRGAALVAVTFASRAFGGRGLGSEAGTALGFCTAPIGVPASL